MPEEDLVELKFRLYDGSDIDPFLYSPAATVAMLKERIVAEWPKEFTTELVMNELNRAIFNSRNDEMELGKDFGGGKKKDGNAIVDLWRDVLKNPLQCWDYRGHKANGLVKGKYPNFKQKGSGESRWMNTAPSWVLPGLEMLEFDVKEICGVVKKDAAAKGGDSWKSLVEEPSKWWHNKARKLNPKAPDFKYKETREGVWLNRLPDWELSKLPPVQDAYNVTSGKNMQKF